MTAVSARDRAGSDIDLSRYAWFDDPIDLARSSDVDCVVEPRRRFRRAGEERRGDGARRRQARGDGQQGAPGETRPRTREGRGAKRRRPRLRGVIGRRHSGRQDPAGGAPRQLHFAALRHPQRHLQLHPLAHGTGLTFESCSRTRSASATRKPIRPSTSKDLDTAHKLAIPTSLAFGTEIDAEAVYVEGISKITPLDLAMAKELGYRIKLGVAERTKPASSSASIRPWCPALPPSRR